MLKSYSIKTVNAEGMQPLYAANPGTLLNWSICRMVPHPQEGFFQEEWAQAGDSS